MPRKPRSVGPVIRQGDRVKITRPLFFVRCGYPLDFHAETEKVLSGRWAEIEPFLKAMGVTAGFDAGRMDRAARKVAEAIAYALIRQAGFGGRDRTIHTREIPDLAGHEFVVEGVRFVKTGTYTTPGSGGDPYDYCPNYLTNEKTHRILRTPLFRDLPFPAGLTGLEIEAANVEKIP